MTKEEFEAELQIRLGQFIGRTLTPDLKEQMLDVVITLLDEVEAEAARLAAEELQ